jgi:hypothetical protein
MKQKWQQRCCGRGGGGGGSGSGGGVGSAVGVAVLAAAAVVGQGLPPSGRLSARFSGRKQL